MKIFHHCKEFDPQELLKQSEAGNSYIKLTTEDYNTFLSEGSEVHTFAGTANGDRIVEKALANAVSDFDKETVLKHSVALMVIISYNKNLKPSLSMAELNQLTDFIGQLPSECDTMWGIMEDSNLNDALKVSLLAMLP